MVFNSSIIRVLHEVHLHLVSFKLAIFGVDRVDCAGLENLGKIRVDLKILKTKDIKLFKNQKIFVSIDFILVFSSLNDGRCIVNVRHFRVDVLAINGKEKHFNIFCFQV